MNHDEKNTGGGQNSRFIGERDSLPGYRRWVSHDYAGWGGAPTSQADVRFQVS